MDSIKTLESVGFTLPSPAYLLGSIIFGIVGYAGYRYGKRVALAYPKWIGMALMLFPYAISQTWLLYLVGCGLCTALYIFRA